MPPAKGEPLGTAVSMCSRQYCADLRAAIKKSVTHSTLSQRAWTANVLIVIVAAGVHALDARLYPGTYKALETFLHITPIQLGALSLAQNLSGNVVR